MTESASLYADHKEGILLKKVKKQGMSQGKNKTNSPFHSGAFAQSWKDCLSRHCRKEGKRNISDDHFEKGWEENT